MNVKIAVCFLLAAVGITQIQAAILDTALFARYVCRSRVDGFKVMVPGSCSKYFQCLEGKAQLNECPRFYDAVNQQCVYKNPGCVETLREILSCEGPCCGVADGGYAVDAKNPAIYYLCANYCVAEKKFCKNGLMFDLVKLECSSPSTCTDCVVTPKPPCEPTTTTCQPTTTPCTTTTKKPCTTTTCEPSAPSIVIITRSTTTTECTTTKSTRTTTKSTRTTTTTKRTTTTTTRKTPTTTTTCSTTTTTCSTTTPCPTTTTSCTTTTTCQTTTPCTTTSCSTTTIKPPCTQAITTTCSTTKAPCTPPAEKFDNDKGLTDASHYVLPSKMTKEEIDNYIRYSCIDKPAGFLLPSLVKCNEYFICRNNVALPVSCGKKYFNIQESTCDLPSNTGCIQAN